MQNPLDTVTSQYGGAATLQALVGSMNDWLDPSASIDAFYSKMWNILTAVGYGLDTWGRILGFGRVIQVTGALKYFGFQQGGTTDYDTFGFAPFYSGGVTTSNFALPDDQYRLALLAKAAANISSCGITSINSLLLALFPARGDVYVTDGEDMTMQFFFTFPLTIPELGIVNAPGLLPVPVGVTATVVSP